MTYTLVDSECGHLYATIWIPMLSVKAERAGGRRFQRCPICKRRAWVNPADTATLTPEQKAAAERIRDSRIP